MRSTGVEESNITIPPQDINISSLQPTSRAYVQACALPPSRTEGGRLKLSHQERELFKKLHISVETLRKAGFRRTMDCARPSKPSCVRLLIIASTARGGYITGEDSEG